jgi:GNAT superfamily N-acetyltransferase
MENLKIRRAKIEEIATLLEFESGIIEAERPYNPILRETDAHYYDLSKLLVSPSTAVFVAENNGEIIATGYVTEKKGEGYMKIDRYAYLGFMYVKPEYRGKGVNQLVLDALIDWGKQQGLTVFLLNVASKNLPAVKAYEKAGFSSLRNEMFMEIEKE